MSAQETDNEAGTLAIRWQRFRSLNDTGWLPLRPITILLGANNAGKTSILAPLLLLKQSLDSETGESGLLTTGPLADLGTFSDIVLGHDPSGSFELSIRWHDHGKPPSDAASPPAHSPGSLDLTFIKGSRPHQIDLARYVVRDYFRRRLLLRSRRTDGSYTLSMAHPRPREQSRTPDIAERRSIRAMRKAMKSDIPMDFLFKGRNLLRAGLQAPRPAKHEALAFFMDSQLELYSSIVNFVDLSITDIFGSLYYVGPLRESPRRIYDVSGETPREVGRRGEFTPEILFRWRNDKDKIDAVHRWLSVFGFNESLTWKEYGETAFGMYIQKKQDDTPTSFLDVGFGMSQVLPLIVQGLDADAGDRIVIEQPEIHLNPNLQAKIADLLVHFASNEVGVIVETHSEHLLLRLRRLIAEGEVDSQDVALYFVEREGEVSSVRPIDLTPNGHIAPKDWPKGFFDDALRESLGLASAQASQKRNVD
jgi:hypothetical protein